ncbi:hypothetical protein [Bacillus sp. FJAT-45350]|uniref:hypothetical protein n=1 Tax=Bacillus sp. FJAT-45350 TaxID=2011014 RepID=UPI000BB6C57F|nr:hypothetical protein [Bacillus sp. FJAT-45350]
MLNQPQPVFSYTIPYYISEIGESIEMFVSEKTYELYLASQKNYPLVIISGSLHPFGEEFGGTTTTLFDKEKAILCIGLLDLQQLSNELIDIAIATELEKIATFKQEEFLYMLYTEDTPEYVQTFIDDLQHTITSIPIAKRLEKKGYRILEREEVVMKDLAANELALKELRTNEPLKNSTGLFLLDRLLFIYQLDKKRYQIWKNQLKNYWPEVFIQLEELQQEIKKMNLSTYKGQRRAINKLIKKVGYDLYTKEVDLKEIEKWELPEAIS